jgi:hypothetical protein
MEIKKERLKSENQDIMKIDGSNDPALKENGVKTPAKSSPAVASIETKAKETPVPAELPKSKESVRPPEKKAAPAQATGKAESSSAVKPDTPDAKAAANNAALKETGVKTPAKSFPAIAPVETKAKEAPVPAELPKSKEYIRPMEKRAEPAQATVKKEPDIVEHLDKLEEKITRNIRQFKEVEEKIRQTEEDIEEIEEEKPKKAVKRIVYFWPKICVEANVCRLPRAFCTTLKKAVDIGKSTGRNGVKSLGDFTGKCAGSLSGSVRLPILRNKINKKFKKLGTFAYQMYTEGRNDILKSEIIEKHIAEVKAFEKEIGELEKRGPDMANGQSVSQESKA